METQRSSFDPCSENYINSYLNIPQVQKALHANVTALPYTWQSCSDQINSWNDMPDNILQIMHELMESGMRVRMFRQEKKIQSSSLRCNIKKRSIKPKLNTTGDTDSVIPVTSTRYSITKLGTPVRTAWYPWYAQGEVGGYAVAYQNLTFVTIRGSGHFVPSYQPARALVFFSSFVTGLLPPSS
ncbi:hypothetical protein RJ639_044594 [Escallonia herrerae]|uniref:Serine carboxypeptidase n=1 Tax=Escallonia herrerae TaxID=1293975 RepID=A0AA89B9T7_9ASTE|nr:hypothetical protein RJ639_044594 [Escallonia herrerae]